MLKRVVAFVFFANYFVGVLAIALSVETAFQLNTPLNSHLYYLLLFCATVFYYTLAYSGPKTPQASDNPRTEWYRKHFNFIKVSQAVLLVTCLSLCLRFLVTGWHKIITLPVAYWLMLAAVPGAAILYYGLLPQSLVSFNLRRTGWLKAFVIGFVWAGCVSLFPVTMLKIEQDITVKEPVLLLWLFGKNWMFCTVNAIMFDIKDYEDDANIELKTFAVSFGLRQTIFYVLIPLLLVGILSFLTFAIYRQFSVSAMLFNFIPFACLLGVAFSLQKPRSILYYLIVIDGLLLIKALCGIAGSFFHISHAFPS